MQLPPAIVSKLSDAKAVLGNEHQKTIDALTDVYSRISEAARIRPALLVCGAAFPNAFAVGTPDDGRIVFTVPILALINNNVDELALVMAHEFSHLLLNHGMQKSMAQQNLQSWAQWIASDRQRKTGRSDVAIKEAKRFLAVEFPKYSRYIEREADDKGFSLAFTVAKYNGAMAKQFHLKMANLPKSNFPAYLSTHPGAFERFDRVELQLTNQGYIEVADELLSAKQWRRLGSLVDRWLRETPQSGAAWYYKGRWLIHRARSNGEIAESFERSVSYFLGSESLGARAQEDQTEVPDAWLHLCVALYDEGHWLESANCSRRLPVGDMKDYYQDRTFRGSLLVGGGEMRYSTHFWIAREASGSKLITNDKDIAASRGPLRDFPPAWRAVRYPTASGQ